MKIINAPVHPSWPKFAQISRAPSRFCSLLRGRDYIFSSRGLILPRHFCTDHRNSLEIYFLYLPNPRRAVCAPAKKRETGPFNLPHRIIHTRTCNLCGDYTVLSFCVRGRLKSHLMRAGEKRRKSGTHKEVGPMFWNLISINCESLGGERRGATHRCLQRQKRKEKPSFGAIDGEVIKLQS